MGEFQWATGVDALAAIRRGENLWSVGASAPDDPDDHDVAVTFDDVFAHEFSAAIDAVAQALEAAKFSDVEEVFREDREFVLLTAADENATPDVDRIRRIASGALESALENFGPARDE